MRKKTIVLVPGLDGTAQFFYRQIPQLSKKLRVVTHPLPDDPECTMHSLVSELETVIAALAPEEDVFLCGESFGGALSLSFALEHPNLLRGLVILNSFPRVRKRFQLCLGPALLKLMPWGAMSTVRRFTEWKLHTSTTLEEDLQTFHERSRAIGRQGYIRRLEILQSYDIRSRLHEIELPTLFLAAAEDHLVPSVAEARYMSERMPRAEMRVLEGFGHICLIHHDFDLLGLIEPWIYEV
jgi:3-oxoadipate enol-lactonase